MDHWSPMFQIVTRMNSLVWAQRSTSGGFPFGKKIWGLQRSPKPGCNLQVPSFLDSGSSVRWALRLYIFCCLDAGSALNWNPSSSNSPPGKNWRHSSPGKSLGSDKLRDLGTRRCSTGAFGCRFNPLHRFFPDVDELCCIAKQPAPLMVTWHGS